MSGFGAIQTLRGAEQAHVARYTESIEAKVYVLALVQVIVTWRRIQLMMNPVHLTHWTQICWPYCTFIPNGKKMANRRPPQIGVISDDGGVDANKGCGNY